MTEEEKTSYQEVVTYFRERAEYYRSISFEGLAAEFEKCAQTVSSLLELCTKCTNSAEQTE